jgi:hypothetical protein
MLLKCSLSCLCIVAVMLIRRGKGIIVLKSCLGTGLIEKYCYKSYNVQQHIYITIVEEYYVRAKPHFFNGL